VPTISGYFPPLNLLLILSSPTVISHSAVLRTLYAYFMDIGQEEVPYIDIPANVVITLSIGPYSAECEVTPLN
jgi:broad specificity phosphatase PhoE